MATRGLIWTFLTVTDIEPGPMAGSYISAENESLATCMSNAEI